MARRRSLPIPIESPRPVRLEGGAISYQFAGDPPVRMVDRDYQEPFADEGGDRAGMREAFLARKGLY